MTQDIYLHRHPALTENALEQLRVMVELFGFVREGGREFMAMLAPVGHGRVGTAIAYEGGATERARQTLVAAVHVRELWHPEEVVWACDSLTRRYDLDRGEVVAGVPPGDDPRASEALALGHCRTSWGPGVRHATLPYGWSDTGELTFRSDPQEWWEGGADEMSQALACAVSPNLPSEVTEQVLARGDPRTDGVFVVHGERLN